MRSNVGRMALGIAVVAVAVILFVVLQDGDGADSKPGGGDDRAAKPSEPAIPTIVVKDGKPVGGVKRLTFEAGERIRFAVRSDSADELHVHGYDVERELPAGRAVRIDLQATIEGIFEAELHGSGEQIAELRVEP